MSPNSIANTIFSGIKSAYLGCPTVAVFRVKHPHFLTMRLNRLPYTPKYGTWNNNENKEIYNHISIERFAKSAGLQGNPDVKIVSKYLHALKIKNKILEVGAAKGRVLEGLLALNHTEITAIERNQKFFDSLTQKFGVCSEIKLLKGDVKDLDKLTQNRYKAILLLWAGLCDFAKHEQPMLLQLLVEHLLPSGVLICDLPREKTTATKVFQQTKEEGSHHIVEVELGKNTSVTYHGYVPSSTEMQQYAKQLNAIALEEINYMTGNGKRSMFFFKKTSSHSHTHDETNSVPAYKPMIH